LIWREAGGPNIEAGAKRPGFGTTLVQRVIQNDLEGNVDLLFEPRGMRVMMTFPLNVPAEFADLAGASAQTT
jgi:two-component sensor histidine kinase